MDSFEREIAKIHRRRFARFVVTELLFLTVMLALLYALFGGEA